MFSFVLLVWGAMSEKTLLKEMPDFTACVFF